MAPQITLDQLIGRFEVIRFDSDGVLAPWPGARPGASEAIEQLNSQGKPYLVLTNGASALPETRATRYNEQGLAIEASRIITAESLLTPYFPI